MPAASTTYPFDTAPLSAPVDRRDVAAFWRTQRVAPPTARIVVGVVVAVVAGAVLLPWIAFVLGALSSSGGWAATFVPVLIVIVVAAAIVVASIAAFRARRTARYRIALFAGANGMSYVPQVDEPSLPGMIFQLGSDRASTDIVRGTHPRLVEFGNHEYTTGSGKNRSTHRWGYVAIKLDVPLPNIVLDARGNNGLGSNLPSSFARDQRLSLEGDFDEHFTLYCPRGYGADALYLFSPDIMQRFIDHAAELDAEIVDDWLFLYMQRPASTTDAETWAWLFGIVGALMTKFEQWSRWRDERLAAHAGWGPSAPAAPVELPFATPAGLLTPPAVPAGVAAPGRRLRKSVSWVGVLAVVAVVAYAVVRFVWS